MANILFTGIGPEIGGIETYAREVFQSQSASNTFYFLTTVEPEKSAFFHYFRSGGAQYLYFPKLFGLKNSLTREKLFSKVLDKYSFDIVHINMTSLNSMYMVNAAVRKNSKVIYYLHNAGSASQNRLVKIISSVVKPFYRIRLKHLTQLDKVQNIAVSEQAGLKVFGPNINFKVILNGVNTNRFTFNQEQRTKIRDLYGIDEHDSVGVVLARLVAIKNHSKAIDVFVNSFPEVLQNLFIVGDGPCRQLIEKKIAALPKDIRSNIFIVGECEEPAKYLHASDVMILTSFAEGLGTSVIEGQASGLPAVVSNGVPESVNVTGRTVFLSLKKDDDTWTQTISECLSDDINRLEMNDIVNRSDFSISAFGERITNLYKL